jgi:hypothetical protein
LHTCRFKRGSEMAEGADVSALSDSALAKMAWEHRREALHGNRDALVAAHGLELELRRRDAIYMSGFGSLAPDAGARARRWWRFWQRRP